MRFVKLMLTVIISAVFGNSIAEIGRKTMPHIWMSEADTTYWGAGLVATSSTDTIRAILKIDDISNIPITGEWSYYIADEDRFETLFRPGDEIGTKVTLGIFEEGQSIILRFTITDIGEPHNMVDEYLEMIGNIFYTGQNRIEVDKYYADTPNRGTPSRQHSEVGRINNNKCIIGIVPEQDGTCPKIIYLTGMLMMEGVETYKIPHVKVTSTHQTGNEYEIDLTVPEGGLFNVIGERRMIDFEYVRDTSYALTGDAVLNIYYTTDGSNPKTSSTRALYSEPFTVQGGTIVKSYAVIENVAHTDWLPSDVETVQIGTSTGIFFDHNKNIRMARQPLISNENTFSLTGRMITDSNRADGVYIIRNQKSDLTFSLVQFKDAR